MASTFYIESGTGRTITDPTQFDPSKTYVESGTGRQVPGTQLAPAAPTTTAPTYTNPNANLQVPQGTPTAPTQQQTPTGFGVGGFQAPPAAGATGPTFLPPTQGSTSSSLMDFANGLDQAVNLAKQKRNALQLGIMQGSQGTLMASDFNSILGAVNRASDTTANSIINRAMEAATPQYQTTQIGDAMYQITYGADGRYMGATKIADIPKQGGGFTYGTATDAQGNIFEIQYDESGKMIGQRFAAAAGPETSAAMKADAKPYTSGALTITQGEKQEMYTILQTGRSNEGTPYGNPMGQDGFVDPQVYLQLLDQWRQNGGLLDDFVKEFPPDNFINPANTWVGAELKKRGVAWKEPSSGSTAGGFTDVEKRKLEQAGLLNAPRQQQLDYLYGSEDDNPFN